MIENKKQSNLRVWQVLNICGQLGFVIAIPAAGFAYLGAILDKKYHTSPWLVIAGLGLAIFCSSIWVWRMLKKIENRS